MKITPQDHRLSIDILVRENPDKTGKEIQEMYEHGELCFKAWKEKRDKKQNETAKWLVDSKYIRITYGGSSELIQYHEVLSAEVKEGHLYWTTITSSLSNTKVVRESGYSVDTMREERTNDFSNSTYNEKMEAITKEQYDNFHCKVKELFFLD